MLKYNKDTGLQQLLGAVFLAFLVLPLISFAGVNQRNGNFYISYTDVSFTEHGSFAIERTYNSRAIGEGLFGRGWGSDMETRLQVTGDGILVIYENGTGKRVHFKARDISRKDIEKAVDKLIQAAVKDDMFVDETQKQRERELLLANSDKRQLWWKRLSAKGLLKSNHAGAGTTYNLIGDAFIKQRVVETATGYSRKRGAQTDKFDFAGHLIRHIDLLREEDIHFYRNAAGQVERIEDGHHVLMFAYNKGGMIAAISDGSGKLLSRYIYRSGLLIRSVNLYQKVFTYRYDNRYNMTGIGYHDGKNMLIAYDHHQLVRYVRSPSGRVRHYDYGRQDSPDGEVLFTQESVGSGDKKRIKIRRFIENKRPDGTTYLTSKSSDRGSLISMATRDELAKNTYDDKGNIIRKVSGVSVIEYIYNDADKVVEIFSRLKGKNEKSEWIRYGYKDHNLIHITSSASDKITLSYNAQDKLSVITSKERVVKLDFNPSGKISRISQKGGDALMITYDDKGEVASSKAESGHREKASPIVKTLDTLLKLVEPADIDLEL